MRPTKFLNNLTLFRIFFTAFVFACTFNLSGQNTWSLRDCVDRAIENNIEIKKNIIETERSYLNKNTAIGNFLPTLNGNFNYAWNVGLTQNITTGGLENSTTQNNSVGANLNVNIFNGFKNMNTLRRAIINIESALINEQITQENVALLVISSFLNVLLGEESLRISQTQLNLSNDQLIRIKALVDSGSVPKGDIFEIEATIASDNQRLVESQNSLRLAKLNLAQLMLVENVDDFEIEKIDIEEIDESLFENTTDELIENSIDKRPAISLQKKNIELRESDIKIAKADYLPTLSAFANFNTRYTNLDRVVGTDVSPTGRIPIGFIPDPLQIVYAPVTTPIYDDPDNLFDQYSDNKGYSFGLQLTVPIFNGFRIKNNVGQSQKNIEQAELDLENSKLQLVKDIETAYINALGAKETYNASLKALKFNQESFKYSEKKFEAGLINTFEYNQIKNNLSRIEIESTRSKFDYIFKIKILEYYKSPDFLNTLD